MIVARYPVLKGLERRSIVTRTDKTWTGNGVDILAVIKEIFTEEPNVGIQFLLQASIGLRAEESMLLRPKDAIVQYQNGPRILVEHGTKGGRFRRVVLTNELEQILEFAGEFANHKSGTTIPVEYSLEEWRARYYYILRKYGVTKKELGVTGHGLRHEFLNILYERKTGVKSPVKGGEKPSQNILQDTLKDIAEAAGHSRVSKATAYVGSHTKMRALASSNLTNEQILQALTDASNDKGDAIKILGCSKSYFYKRLKLIIGDRLGPMRQI